MFLMGEAIVKLQAGQESKFLLLHVSLFAKNLQKFFQCGMGPEQELVFFKFILPKLFEKRFLGKCVN